MASLCLTTDACRYLSIVLGCLGATPAKTVLSAVRGGWIDGSMYAFCQLQLGGLIQFAAFPIEIEDVNGNFPFCIDQGDFYVAVILLSNWRRNFVFTLLVPGSACGRDCNSGSMGALSAAMSVTLCWKRSSSDGFSSSVR